MPITVPGSAKPIRVMNSGIPRSLVSVPEHGDQAAERILRESSAGHVGPQSGASRLRPCGRRVLRQYIGLV